MTTATVETTLVHTDLVEVNVRLPEVDTTVVRPALGVGVQTTLAQRVAQPALPEVEVTTVQPDLLEANTPKIDTRTAATITVAAGDAVMTM